MSTTAPGPLYQPAGTPAGLESVRSLVNTALDVLREVSAARLGPVAPGGPEGARTAARHALAAPLLPEHGGEGAEVLADLVRSYAQWSVDITHPAALARMQPPPTDVAAAAELVGAILNQSLHAWESGPFALELDRWVIAQLAELVGYDSEEAGGTLTSGGSVSNLMAMTMARDTTIADKLGRHAFQEGLLSLGVQPVVLCPQGVHFSIERAVRLLGIGEANIVTVPIDKHGRMIPEEADRILTELPEGQLAVALVAVAGSTDLGIVDPLPELAAIARRHGVWLHADAAYGAGALFSPRLRPMLAGLELADSVTMDLHKFGWTPASSAALLVRRAETMLSFGLQPTTCLSADDDTCAGYIGSQNTSLQTTRRVDALKIAVSMRTLGREAVAAMVDTCHDLAKHAAARIAAEPRLELGTEPPLTAVLFRYLPTGSLDADAFNGALRRRVMEQGSALLARTHIPHEDGGSRVFLKLMLLNPETTTGQLDAILDDLLALAAELAAELATELAAELATEPAADPEAASAAESAAEPAAAATGA
ncbi:aminotransferase class V-fold PLP-dependent enzyme [Kitasatospora sp. NBC_01287]|uniref:pyridoxal phosphate-dependent decarboxylase family protein n=1 Tax=Kitasatospora sp. NBC_01287 TaxID=2903573 RepID=UPI002257388B|nr:aminotransferase class V-fold PLP-dependent enzyme [Kitasatospora sp. NBC_01287]MCX4744049.1 aminotransferase class V-fold PLP-dependent enzyme [Kitasatospora sp. NBC_01287]